MPASPGASPAQPPPFAGFQVDMEAAGKQPRQTFAGSIDLAPTIPPSMSQPAEQAPEMQNLPEAHGLPASPHAGGPASGSPPLEEPLVPVLLPEELPLVGVLPDEPLLLDEPLLDELVDDEVDELPPDELVDEELDELPLDELVEEEPDELPLDEPLEEEVEAPPVVELPLEEEPLVEPLLLELLLAKLLLWLLEPLPLLLPPLNFVPGWG
jgi:hypothetical protein